MSHGCSEGRPETALPMGKPDGGGRLSRPSRMTLWQRVPHQATQPPCVACAALSLLSGWKGSPSLGRMLCRVARGPLPGSSPHTVSSLPLDTWCLAKTSRSSFVALHTLWQSQACTPVSRLTSPHVCPAPRSSRARETGVGERWNGTWASLLPRRVDTVSPVTLVASERRGRLVGTQW